MVLQTNQDVEVVAGNGSGWRFAKRWALLSLFCYLTLYYLPALLGVVPGTWRLERWYSAAVTAAASAVFDFDAPSGNQLMHGGGENLSDLLAQGFLLILSPIVGLLGAVSTRSHERYVRLQESLWVWSRYALAVILIGYGAVKVVPSQFGQLDSSRLAMTYGQSSPVQLLWNLMAFSTPYTVFAGCAELLPGVLLLFRRTTLVGALLAFAVLLNVVMLNLCYNVPVKLHSVNYLALAAFLIAPEADRLCRVLFSNGWIEPSKLSMPYPMSRRKPLAMMLAKVAIVGMIGFNTFCVALNQGRVLAKQQPVPSSRLTSGSFSWIWQ